MIQTVTIKDATDDGHDYVFNFHHVQGMELEVPHELSDYWGKFRVFLSAEVMEIYYPFEMKDEIQQIYNAYLDFRGAF